MIVLMFYKYMYKKLCLSQIPLEPALAVSCLPYRKFRNQRLRRKNRRMCLHCMAPRFEKLWAISKKCGPLSSCDGPE